MQDSVLRVSLPTSYRAIFISDIHGDFYGLNKLLEKVKYNEGVDYLFILGDIIEKGDNSLLSLRKVIELLKASSRCYALIGNNDDIMPYVRAGNKELVLNYICRRKKSIFSDMARELGITINENLNLDYFYSRIFEAYKLEFEFFSSLPVIIETEDFLLAHAGLYPNDDYLNTDYDYATNKDEQGNVNYRYPKPLIVGHWSASLYGTTQNLNPYFNKVNNTVSIDGANSIKNYGQLNALILSKENGTSNFNFASVDLLPEKEVINGQVGTAGIKIIWPINQIEISNRTEKVIEGYLKRYENRGSDEKNIFVSVPKEFVYQYSDGKYYLQEFGNYLLNLKKGDKVKIIFDGEEHLIAKFNGEVGIVKKESLVK